MEIWVLVLIGLAVWHFIYEGIIAPSLRMVLRHKMFRLRDDVRRLRADYPDQVSEEVFSLMQSLINNAITLVHQINFIVLLRFKKDEVIDHRIDDRNRLIAECPKDEIREIREKAATYLAIAFGINHGGWVIYLVPILIILICSRTIWRWITAASILPDEEIDKYMPTATY